ncbi:MAG: DUF1499 domain-containing protein [Candidatus Rokuibacteriota bacterium]|nr:MAG: DUF1499 domain-containing protein [Candidatus Rokubacteria bacterium]
MLPSGGGTAMTELHGKVTNRRGAMPWIAIAAGVVVVIGLLVFKMASGPRIHDITTDTEDPPQFVALLAARQASSNGAVYGGPAVAAEQKKGYPDIIPLLLPDPPERAFARIEAAARGLGWRIVAAVPAEGRLEATATTPLLRFKDDVVVRVVPALNGSQVDVRSVSRFGRGDMGANAKRVRAFLAALAAPTPR